MSIFWHVFFLYIEGIMNALNLLEEASLCWITESGGESIIEKFNPFKPYNASVMSM
jgi:hypothetical protein